MPSKKKTVVKVVTVKAAPSGARRRQTVTELTHRTSTLGSIGKAIGGHFGGRQGARVGKTAGDWIGKVTGMGSYSVNKNVLTTGQVPSFRSETNGSIIVSHRELISPVTGSTTFEYDRYSINPGLSDCFPWLSSVARNYEQYEFLGLIYEFKSTSANALNSTNTALGSVVLSTQYDVYDPAFTSRVQMCSYEFTTLSAPSEDMIHPVECDPKENSFKNNYVRTEPVPSGADQRLYDIGNLYIATEGMQAAAQIGDLWVSYVIKLLKPKLITEFPAVQHITVVPVTGSLFAGANTAAGYDTLLASGATNTLTFLQTGDYVVHFCAVSATSYTFNGSSSITGGGVYKSGLAGITTASIANGSGSIYPMHTVMLRVNSLPAALVLSNPTVVGATAGDVFIVRTPSGQVSALGPLGSLSDKIETLEQQIKSLMSSCHSIEEESPLHIEAPLPTPVQKRQPQPSIFTFRTGSN